MGGSNFDFAHSRLEWDVIEKIERIIKRNNTEIPIKERPSWQDPEYYEKYPEEKLYSSYSDETINEFKKGLNIIKEANIYIKRIDNLLCGDDGEETFHERLKENLNKLETNDKL